MNITKNEKARRFEVTVDGGIGFLRYRIEGETMHLLYVEVPPDAQGRGIAGELTHHVLEFARENGLKVVPVCGYVVAYMQRHPEYAELLTQ